MGDIRGVVGFEPNNTRMGDSTIIKETKWEQTRMDKNGQSIGVL